MSEIFETQVNVVRCTDTGTKTQADATGPTDRLSLRIDLQVLKYHNTSNVMSSQVWIFHLYKNPYWYRRPPLLVLKTILRETGKVFKSFEQIFPISDEFPFRVGTSPT